MICAPTSNISDPVQAIKGVAIRAGHRKFLPMKKAERLSNVFFMKNVIVADKVPCKTAARIAFCGG